jgi:tetratricopeptide (TPR) repeat protein
VASEIWDQGLATCDRAIALNPRAIRARFLRSRILFQTQRLPDALEELKRVLDLNPEHQDALQMAGYIATQLGQDAEALEFYGRYLDLVPSAVAVRSKLAYDLAQAGNFPAAVVLVQEGLKHDSTDVNLWEQLGGYAFSAAHKINSGNQPETTEAATVAPEAVPFFRIALDAYQRVFAARGAQTAVAQLRSMVSAYMVLGEMDNAVSMADRAVATYPDDADLWWVYCDALHRADRIPEAITALDRVTTLNPAFPSAALRRGEWLLEADRLTEAAATLKALATSDPTQADAAGGILIAYAYAKGVQPKRWGAAIPPLEAARGIPGMSGETNSQINFWLAFSIMQGAIPEQEPRTVQTAQATLPKFQRARELLRLAADYPRKINVDLVTLVTTIEQYIEIQQMIIRRGR